MILYNRKVNYETYKNKIGITMKVIPKENLIIEVKSSYTYNMDRIEISNKIKTVMYNGFKCYLWIFDKKGILLNV